MKDRKWKITGMDKRLKGQEEKKVNRLKGQKVKRFFNLLAFLPLSLLALFTIHYFLFSGFVFAADPVAKIAKKISTGAKSLKNRKVAVLPFPYHDGRESQGSTIVSERLITKLVEQKKLEVIERSLLEKVFSELKLQSSGAIDEQSAKQLGKVLGVEAIVSGTLIDLGEKEVEVNARLIQAESGQILVAASGAVERFWREETTVAKQKASAPEAKKTTSEKAKEERPMMQEHAQVLPPGEQKLPPVSQPMDEPQQTEAPMHLSNRGQMERDGSGMHHGMPPPLPPGEDMEIKEDEDPLFGGPSEALLFETDLGHERENPFGREMLQGLVFLKNREPERAQEIFAKLTQNPRDPRKEAVAHLGLSMSLFQIGHREKAIQIAQNVARHSRGMPKVSAASHFLLGRYAERMDKWDTALENYLEVVRTSPFQTPLVRSAGRRLLRLETSKMKEKMRGRMQQRREMRREFRRQ